MKKIKKALLFLLAVSFILPALASCGNSEESGVSIVTTIFAPYDFARAVGGDGVSVKMLLSVSPTGIRCLFSRILKDSEQNSSVSLIFSMRNFSVPSCTQMMTLMTKMMSTKTSLKESMMNLS